MSDKRSNVEDDFNSHRTECREKGEEKDSRFTIGRRVLPRARTILHPGDGCTSLDTTVGRVVGHLCTRECPCESASATCTRGRGASRRHGCAVLGRDAEIKPCTGAITIRRYPIGRRFVERQRRSERNEFLA